MTVVFIQGASRGLGLAFVQSLLKRSNTTVFAAARTLNKTKEDGISLLSLQNSFPNLELISMDVTKEENVIEASSVVKEKVGKLDLLINCSGMLHPTGKGETKLEDINLTHLSEVFNLNTFAPLIMAKHFTPLLQKGNGLIGCQKNHDDKDKSHCGVIANLSARIGSIEDNKLGGWYSYRMSKSALNMANRCLSIELGRGRKRIISICLHPGTVDTDLTRPYHKGIPKEKLFSSEHSAEMLLKIIDNITINDSGSFFAYDGQKIPF